MGREIAATRGAEDESVEKSYPEKAEARLVEKARRMLCSKNSDQAYRAANSSPLFGSDRVI